MSRGARDAAPAPTADTAISADRALAGYAIAAHPIEDLRAMIADNLGGAQLRASDLPRVTVPAGGGRLFAVASIDGDATAKILSGVIIHRADQRAYWSRPMGAGDAAPDCVAHDGQRGVGTPGGICAECPLAAWGSAGPDRPGQACRASAIIYLVGADAILPTALVVPPSSLAVLRRYTIALTAQAVMLGAVVTECSLIEAQSDQGIRYAQLAFRAARRLAPPEIAIVRAYADAIRPVLAAAPQARE